MPDDLYERYQYTAAALTEHRATCPACLAGTECPAGRQLDESFARLQDAYLTRLRRPQ